MSKPSRFPPVNSKSAKKTTFKSENSTVPRAAKMSQRSSVPLINKTKVSSASSFAKRGKVLRKPETLDVISTDSTTNLSDKDATNAIALKKEINEWRRQEALRSRIKQVLDKAYPTDAEDDKVKIDNGSDCFFTEISNFRRRETPVTADDDQDMDGVNQSKSKKERAGKENMPAVSWIPLQPVVSARTSLRSVADYLSETSEEVFIPRRTLCNSPETLEALENAEKLLEDAEEKITQINHDALHDDDLDDYGFLDKNIYVRNVVASMFEKGYYDPELTGRREHFKTKFTVSGLTKSRPPAYKNVCFSKELEKLTSDTVPSRPPKDECMFCKSKRDENCQKSCDDMKIRESSETGKELAKEIPDNSKPEKLSLQKGPSISIKGDLSVQTDKIVDIRPDPNVHQVSKEQSENVVTFECRHDVSTRKKSPDRCPIDEGTPQTTDETGKDHAKEATSATIADSLTVIPKRDARKPSHPEFPPIDEQNELPRENWIEDYLATSKPAEQKTSKTFWEELEALGLDSSLSDLSLQEPPVLGEMDSMLESQRKIMRQVQGATENLDRFLTDRSIFYSPNETFLVSEHDEKASEEQTTVEAAAKLSEQVERQQRKISASARRIMELSKEIEILSRNKPPIVPCGPGAVKVPEPDQLNDLATKSKNVTAIPSDVDFTDDSIALDSRTVKGFGVPEVGAAALGHDVFAESSKDERRTRAFDNVSAGQFQGASSKKSKTKDRQEERENERSFAQMSSHTETRSTSGVENVKSVQLSNDNNLDVNEHRKYEKSVGDILKSLQDVQLDEDVNQPGEFMTAREFMLREKSKPATCSNVFEEPPSGEKAQARQNREEEQSKVERPAEKLESQRKDGTDKVSDHLENNSAKTSHLIESISDISSSKVDEYVEHLSGSLRLSTISNDKSNDINKPGKSSKEESTESKIEKQISEARENLNILMHSMTSRDSDVNYADERTPSHRARDELQKKSDRLLAVQEVPTTSGTDVLCTSMLRPASRRLEREVSGNPASVRPRQGLDNSRSIVAMLEENSSAMMEKTQQQKMSILKKLELCAVPPQRHVSRFFTSTVLADVELTGNTSSIMRFKGLSESSSDTHSEGEIRFSSSTSYSAGEIKRILIKPSSSSKSSSSNNDQPDQVQKQM